MEHKNLSSYIDDALENPIYFLKEYFSIIIAVPYFIGGAKQVMSLMLQSPDLIMFFSFTQVFIDGIITICKMAFLILLLNIYNNFLKDQNKSEHGLKFIKKLSTGVVVFFLLICAFIYIYKLHSDLTYVNFFKFTLYSCMILLYLNLTLFLKDKFFYYYIYTSIFALLIIIPAPFDFYNKIENINVLTKKLNSNHRNFKLIFQNDQYLIYGQKNNDLVTYKVLKMDELFTSETP